MYDINKEYKKKKKIRHEEEKNKEKKIEICHFHCLINVHKMDYLSIRIHFFFLKTDHFAINDIIIVFCKKCIFGYYLIARITI